MCIIAFRWEPSSDQPLTVWANRDEFRDRPAAATLFWPDRPTLLAGRDLRAGGTWLGVTRSGRFAALTNIRQAAPITGRASRGDLVVDALMSPEPAAVWMARQAAQCDRYAPFNLLLFDGQSLWWMSSEAAPRALAPGHYGVSNALLDTPWPKLLRLKAATERLWADPSTRSDVSAHLMVLQDATPAPDDQLPETGVGLAWERQLSSVFIPGAGYGTRNCVWLRRQADQWLWDEWDVERAQRLSFHCGPESSSINHNL